MNTQTPTNNTVSQPAPKPQSTTEPTGNNRSCFSRTVAVVSTPVVHLILNILMGALKGLERATEPAELLLEYGQNLGGKGSYTGKIFGALGFFVGFIVGIVVAPVGLLLGLAEGFTRGVYKMPSACQKSCFEGFSYAMKDTIKHFSISGYKVAIVAAVTSLLLASSFIGIAALIGGAALASLLAIIEIPAFLSSMGLTALAYSYSHKCPPIPINASQIRSHKVAHTNTALGFAVG